MNNTSIYFRLFNTVMESAFFTGLMCLLFALLMAAIYGEMGVVIITGVLSLPMLGYQTLVLLFCSRSRYNNLVYDKTVDLFDKLLPYILLLVTVPIAVILLLFINSEEELYIWVMALIYGLFMAYVHTWLFAKAFMARFSENNPEF